MRYNHIRIGNALEIGRGYLQYVIKECENTNEVLRRLQESPLLVEGLHDRNRAVTRASILYMLEQKKEILPLMVEIIDGEQFCVSAMPEDKDDFASYIEVLVTEKDEELYKFFIQQTGTLSVAGINEEIPNIGEKYDDNIYALFVDKNIHDQIINAKDTSKE